VGIRVALGGGVSTGVAVGDMVVVANGIEVSGVAGGQGVGVGVGLSSSRGKRVGSVGSCCSVLQAIAVNSRIEEKAKQTALYRLINTTGERLLWSYKLQFTIGVAAITLLAVEEFPPLLMVVNQVGSAPIASVEYLPTFQWVRRRFPHKMLESHDLQIGS